MINKMTFVKNFIFYFAITVISFIIIKLMLFWGQNSCFWNDDIYYSLYVGEEGIFDILISNGHGAKYFGQFIDKFLSMGLPCILGIHPENFMSSWHALCRGIFAVLTFLCISKFSTIYERSKILYFIFYCLLTVTFIFSPVNKGIAAEYYPFYRYCFSLLFFAVFWLFIYKNITGLERGGEHVKIKIIARFALRLRSRDIKRNCFFHILHVNISDNYLGFGNLPHHKESPIQRFN